MANLIRTVLAAAAVGAVSGLTVALTDSPQLGVWWGLAMAFGVLIGAAWQRSRQPRRPAGSQHQPPPPTPGDRYGIWMETETSPRGKAPKPPAT